MKHANFVHLRVHTAYSLSQGALQIKKVASLCERCKMPAVAITDTRNLFGALEFSEVMCGAGIQPIIGCVLAVDVEDRTAGGNGAGLARREPDHLLLLAQNETGYGNLMALSSRAFLETDPGETPQVRFSDLAGRSEGLLALSGGLEGPLARLLLGGQEAAAKLLLERLAEAFPGRLYVELQRHNLPRQLRIESALVDLADALELPLVATNDVHFADESMFAAHDALTCVAAGSYVSQDDRPRYTKEHRFKTPEEMRLLFADLPEAIGNTLVIARRCAYRVPLREPILPSFADNEAEALRGSAAEGLEARLAGHVLKPDMSGAERDKAAAPYHERLEFELKVIIEMGFPGYFLIVADFIKWAKQNDIPVGPGRGSGAGSVVAWALTITDLDPLRFGLLFERFLNPERVSMPDFDIDFCQEKRDRVIHYVQEKYGADRVAQIITFGTFQARAVLRDVGRVLEMPYSQVDRLCKMIPNNPANPVSLADAIKGEPRLQEARQEDSTVAQLLDIGKKLEGLYRHASTHAAGVVIADRPLDRLVPVYRDPRSDMPVTQFNMKWVEKAGLVKFDFLGLKTLTVLHKAQEMIEARGVEIDLSALPLDDGATYELLGRGDTVGVFQLESSGMRDMLRQLRPTAFEDIIALVALYRPGPMENIPKYLACRQGQEAPDYLHPSLKDLLTETYGVIIYQEQVMKIAQILSGFSLGQADLLRRAMGKKIKSEMAAQRQDFIDGAAKNGIAHERASSIFDLVDKFAGYGFNKCHSAGYAMIAYQTAWMKANYPVEFLAASMTLDLGNTDKLNVFKQELERLDIDLLPPDVNRSAETFAVEVREAEEGAPRRAIRYALAAIKNVGLEAMRGMVAERETAGPFKSLDDFVNRVDPRAVNKKQLENLARAGAFDQMNPNRHQVFEGVETILSGAGAATEDRESGQGGLFGDGGEDTPALVLPAVPPWPPMDRLREEFEAMGFYLSAHPIDAYQGRDLERLGVIPYAHLAARTTTGAGRAHLAGTVLAVRERTNKQGNRYAFVQFSDPSGMFETVIFSDILSAAREVLGVGNSLLLKVDANAEGEELRLNAVSVQPLDDAVRNSGAGLKVYLDNGDSLNGIKKLLDEHGGGRGLVTFAIRPQGGRKAVEIRLPGRYFVTPPIRDGIKGLPGVAHVQDV